MAKKKKSLALDQIIVKVEPVSDSEDSIIAGFELLSLETPGLSKKTRKLVRRWNEYFQKGDLGDYQRLCRDVGLDETLSSKTQCRLVCPVSHFCSSRVTNNSIRQALKKVHINIVQFLDAKEKPADVKHFKNVGALARYTRDNHAFFPNRGIPKGSPLRTLLRMIG